MKTIVGVPESITRAQYLSLMESVGFVVEDLRKLEFCHDGIYAHVIERNRAGGLRVDASATHCATCGAPDCDAVTNKVFIPVRDD